MRIYKIINDKPLHKVLWKLNKDLANACFAHAFVRGITDGSLNKNAFKIYVAQDTFFLKAFRKAYALAIAKCDDLNKARIFHKLMGGVLEELNLHIAYSKKLGINLSDVEPLPTCRAYTDFLLRVAWQNDVDEIVSAMAPCMILYAFLGRELAKTKYHENYADWIKTYSSKEVQELAKEMEELLDSVAKDSKIIRDNYRHAMKCELDFFEEPMCQMNL